MTLDVAKADIDVVNLIRLRRSDHGSEGIMVFQHFCCFTMELPWRDNLRSLSCIPPGAYLCELRLSCADFRLRMVQLPVEIMFFSVYFQL